MKEETRLLLYVPVSPWGQMWSNEADAMRSRAQKNIEECLGYRWRELYLGGWRIKRAILALEEYL